MVTHMSSFKTENSLGNVQGTRSHLVLQLCRSYIQNKFYENHTILGAKRYDKNIWRFPQAHVKTLQADAPPEYTCHRTLRESM